LTQLSPTPEFWHLTLWGLDNSSTKFYGGREHFLFASQTDDYASFFLTNRAFKTGPRFAFLIAGDDESMGINGTVLRRNSGLSLISLELIDEVAKGPELNDPTMITYLVALGNSVMNKLGNLTQAAIQERSTLKFDSAVLIIDLATPANTLDFADRTSKHISLRDDESAIRASFASMFHTSDVVGAQGPVFFPLSLWCCPACFIGCPVEILLPPLWGMVAFKTICCLI